MLLNGDVGEDGIGGDEEEVYVGKGKGKGKVFSFRLR